MIRSAEQYGLADKFLDLMTFDVTRSPMRRGGWLDAIITDPPCSFLLVQALLFSLIRGRRSEGRSQTVRQEGDSQETTSGRSVHTSRRFYGASVSAH